MKLWLNRDFLIKISIPNTHAILNLSFTKITKQIHLITNIGQQNITLTNSFNGKNVILWLTSF